MTSETTAASIARPATDKQVALIVKLLAERVAPEIDTAALSSRDASAVIDILFAAPRKPIAAAQPGYYTRAGEVIVVKENREGTRTYAKRLVITGAGRASWEYAPGIAAALAGTTPLTVAEAARLGHQHGVCVVCARTLTNPASVEAGIGPVCASRL